MAKRNCQVRRWTVPGLAVACCLTGVCVGSPSFAAWSTLVNNGDPANRVDIVFLGDGYTQTDLDAGLYTAHVQDYLGYMFGATGYLADPFPRYNKYFNVHKIDVVSQESGADHPAEGIFRNTALDAKYDTSGIDRLLTIDTTKANSIVTQTFAGTGITTDIRLVTVNDAKYGGSGGSWATYAGANGESRDIALHELSHAFSGTADEYATNPATYAGPEPQAVNTTKDPTGAKWSQWQGFVDPRGNYLNVGAFAGAADFTTGLYRPSLDSKMRSLGRPFNAVVREKSILDIYARVKPLDDWLDNSATIQSSQLWLDVVDPATIFVDWFIDNQKVATNYGQTLDLTDFAVSAGMHTIKAHVYDEVVNHANDGSLLDLVRTHLDALQQDVIWNVNYSPVPILPGDYNLDHRVDASDYAIWKNDYGSSVKLSADGNRDGVVNVADYVVWRDNVGNSSAAANISDLSTPEPASWGLTVVAFVAVGCRFSWRRPRHAPVFCAAGCV